MRFVNTSKSRPAEYRSLAWRSAAATASGLCELVGSGLGHFGVVVSLTCVTLPNTVVEIEGSAFQGCSQLRDVVLPQALCRLGPSAFDGCSSLVSMVIPKAVTVIHSRTFAACRSLTEVTLPINLEVIQDEAFIGCVQLGTMCIPGSVKTIGAGVPLSAVRGLPMCNCHSARPKSTALRFLRPMIPVLALCSLCCGPF